MGVTRTVMNKVTQIFAHSSTMSWVKLYQGGIMSGWPLILWLFQHRLAYLSFTGQRLFTTTKDKISLSDYPFFNVALSLPITLIPCLSLSLSLSLSLFLSLSLSHSGMDSLGISYTTLFLMVHAVLPVAPFAWYCGPFRVKMWPSSI